MGVSNGMEVEEGTKSITADESVNSITEDEAALYDRQIRLWGVECQRRLRDSKLLIVGLNGLGLEIVKNLTLTGVKSITIIDNTIVSLHDSSAQFYACQAALGGKRSEASISGIQELNPNVKIEVDTEDISSKTAEFISNFNVVFITDHPLDVMIRLNTLCREKNVLFYCGETWGFYGYGFCDLNHYVCHSMYKEQALQEQKAAGPKRNNNPPFREKIEYTSLGECFRAKVGLGLKKKCSKILILAHIMKNFRETHKRLPKPASREEDLKRLKEATAFTLKELDFSSDAFPEEMLELSFGELSPVCAVVGGELASEMIKALSMKPETLDNFFLFDGPTTTGCVETIVVQG